MPIDNYDIKYNKDFCVVVGNNGSGKTTLMKYFLNAVPKDKLWVLNCGGAKQWFDMTDKDKMVIPPTYDSEWFNKWVLKFLVNTEDGCLIMDDADNFSLKDDKVLKSAYINARRLNIGGWLSVRRLNWIPIEIYDNAKYCFFSRQNADRNIWYIAEVCGMDIARKLKDLDLYVFLVYEPKTGLWSKIKVPYNG